MLHLRIVSLHTLPELHLLRLLLLRIDLPLQQLLLTIVVNIRRRTRSGRILLTKRLLLLPILVRLMELLRTGRRRRTECGGVEVGEIGIAGVHCVGEVVHCGGGGGEGARLEGH